MKKLITTKRITLATLKSFAKRNSDNLFVKNLSDFDGMTDCVEFEKNPTWKKSRFIDASNYYRTGIEGIYTVGNSRDYFTKYEDGEYIGIKIYNCCGSAILAIKK